MRETIGPILGICLIAFLLVPLQPPPLFPGREVQADYYNCSDCADTYDCLETAQINLAYEMQGQETAIDNKEGEIAAKNAEISNAMAAGEDPTPLLLERKALEVERDQLQDDYDLMSAKMDGIDVGFGCCQ